MRNSVREVFVAFTAPLEGVIPYCYQDVKGLVSTGIGNLIDPVSMAIGLPWVHLDGTPATREEIVAEWMRIKNLPPDARGRTAAMLGHLYAKPHTRLRLTPVSIEHLVQSKLHANERYLLRAFPDYETWPADAQLGVLSMAWAVGPAFWSPTAGRNHWPKLTAALRGQDFRTAAVECFMPEERTISGLRPRNRANNVLFRNAAHVIDAAMDHDHLFYPTDLDAAPVDREAITQPELPDLDDDPTDPGDSTKIITWDVVRPDVPTRSFPGDDEPDDAA